MAHTSLGRRCAAGATALAVVATAAVVGAGSAYATHGSEIQALTASNGGNAITYRGGSQIGTPQHTFTDAAWAPDGSRAVFVTETGGIATIRYTGSANVLPIADPQPEVRRASPKWVGKGGAIAWAAKSPDRPWRIEETISGYGGAITTVSPDDGYHYLNLDTNSSGMVVERQADDGHGNPVGPAEIGILKAGVYTRIITDAASPTLRPVGLGWVAFVRGGQIWSYDVKAGNLIQVTANAATHTDPAWGGRRPMGGVRAGRRRRPGALRRQARGQAVRGAEADRGARLAA